MIYVSGIDPVEVYAGLFKGGFGSLVRIGQTLVQATPLMFTALGLIFAFKCGVWNIGAEGQLLMGAVGATLAGLFINGVPKPAHIFLVTMASITFGAGWAAIPAALKVRFRTNEIITSLLLNFVASWFVIYMLRWPLKPELYAHLVSDKIATTAWLPIILPGTALHAGIIIAGSLAVAVWFILQKSVLGYRIKAIGVNPDTAMYGGIPVGRVIMISMLLSGSLAGMAGMAQVAGVQHLLRQDISPGYGFLSILVSFVGRLNPLGVVIVAIFLGGLLSGGYSVQAVLGIDITVVHVLIAVIMFGLVIQPFIENRLARII